MRMRKDQPPAPVPDPLDQADHVALGIPAVAIGQGFVAELERAEENHAPPAVGKQDSDRPLRSVQDGELEPRPFGADAAEAGLIGGEDGVAFPDAGQGTFPCRKDR